MSYQVAEIFESINGEGQRAGELAVFVRLSGCNLNCAYCDTKWASCPDTVYTAYELPELVQEVTAFSAKNVTVTGGEPLLFEGVGELLQALVKSGRNVEVETNGSIPLARFIQEIPKVSYTMDYKLPKSGMEYAMRTENFVLLRPADTVKFVVSDRADLECAYRVAGQFGLHGRVPVYLSPVFGEIEPEEIVAFMKEYAWTEARLQLQLHKIIWEPQKRGV